MMSRTASHSCREISLAPDKGGAENRRLMTKGVFSPIMVQCWCLLTSLGDVGMKVDSGSSRYFTVTLLVFEDHDVALAVEERMCRLKRELGLPDHFEFHFSNLKASVRVAFLKALAPYEFFYFTIVINKAKLYGKGFQIADSFYKYTCSLVFETAKPYLREAVVVIDGSGSRPFKRELSTYLRRRVAGPKDEVKLIRKIKVQDSKNNHLLQMADMICGAVARYHTEKSDYDDYRCLISHREMNVQFWPK
jgi:Protein of unknown function (DUF3800)